MTKWKEGGRYPLSEKAIAADKAREDADRTWREAERADLEAYKAQYPADKDAPEPKIYKTRRHAKA